MEFRNATIASDALDGSKEKEDDTSALNYPPRTFIDESDIQESRQAGVAGPERGGYSCDEGTDKDQTCACIPPPPPPPPPGALITSAIPPAPPPPPPIPNNSHRPPASSSSDDKVTRKLDALLEAVMKTLSIVQSSSGNVVIGGRGVDPSIDMTPRIAPPKPRNVQEEVVADARELMMKELREKLAGRNVE